MPGPKLYWRLRGYETGTGGNGSLACTDAEFRATPGGPNVATGGTATASSVFSTFGPANAFDGNSGTVFSSSNGGSEQWIQYQFPAPVEINEILWTLGGVLNGAHRSMDVYSSDDGTLWTWEWGHYKMVDWLANESRTLTRPNAPIFSPRTRWRCMCLAPVNNGSFVALSEVEFRATPGGADQATGGTVIKSSEFSSGAEAAVNAFDNTISTLWAGASGVPQWIGYQMGSAFYCQELVLSSRNDGAWQQAPTRVVLQSCDDDKTWADVHWIENIPWSAQGQTIVVQQPSYSAIGIALAASETPIGAGALDRIHVAAVAGELPIGAGAADRIHVAAAVAENVTGPPVAQLWLANVAIETIVLPSRMSRTPPVQIIAG